MYPASVRSITDWLASLLTKVKSTTAKSYIASLRSHHVENGIDGSAFCDPRIDLVIRGGEREYGIGQRTLRLPLTADILEKLLRHIPSDYNGANLKAALCTGFAAFLRSGEFTWDSWDPLISPRRHLARKHIHFNSDGSVSLTLPASKTDPFGAGTEIQLAASQHSPLCPVHALRCLYNQYPTQPNSPAFNRTFGTFSKSYLIEKVREYLLQAGLTTCGYFGHSLRKGAAITAAAKGIPHDEIKLLGRWKSDAVDIYINDVTIQSSKLLSVNSKLLTSPPHTSLGPLSAPHLSSTSSSPTTQRLGM